MTKLTGGVRIQTRDLIRLIIVGHFIITNNSNTAIRVLVRHICKPSMIRKLVDQRKHGNPVSLSFDHVFL